MLTDGRLTHGWLVQGPFLTKNQNFRNGFAYCMGPSGQGPTVGADRAKATSRGAATHRRVFGLEFLGMFKVFLECLGFLLECSAFFGILILFLECFDFSGMLLDSLATKKKESDATMCILYVSNLFLTLSKQIYAEVGHRFTKWKHMIPKRANFANNHPNPDLSRPGHA